MAKVSKIYKLKSVSSKNIKELYDIYRSEYSRVVSTKYRIFGGKNVYATQKSDFDFLNEKQLETEVNIAKSQGLYGKRLVSYVKNLVRSSVKYTYKQNASLLENLNNIIKKVWSAAAGRSTKGKASSTYSLSTANISPEEAGLLEIMINHGGENNNYTSYLLQLDDVAGQSYYFNQVYQYVRQYLVDEVDEMYKS